MAPDPASAAEGGYTAFGWQGINLTVPATWNLVFTQGDYRKGHIRLADDASVRLEMRWDLSREAHSPSSTVNTYLARLRKKAKKDGTSLSVQRDLNLASPIGKDVECYRWVADQQAVAMMSRCTQCSRTVHVQLLGSPAEPLKGLGRTVFSSLRDHPDNGTHLWRFFDVEFRSPADLPLARRGLQSGCIRMLFAKGLVRLEFVRASLAQMLLAGTDLAQWFEQFYAKPLKRRSFSMHSAAVRGHPGIRVEGRVWLLTNPLRLLGRPRVVRAACWHCEDTNRLFICSFDGPKGQADVLPQAIEGFRCCENA